MAWITSIDCPQCGITKQLTVGSGNSIPNLCYDCADKNAKTARAVHLKGLEALTLEERIAKCEAWQYDYRPYTGPTRY
jgi:hypothetical protein